MNVGFTGTQGRMPDAQILKLIDALLRLAQNLPGEELVVHHGACVGADKVFHDAMVALRDDLRQSHIRIHAHPSTFRSKVAEHTKADVIYPAKPPLERNPDIVNPSEFLIACPKDFEEEVRSGTWTTVRYARKMGLHILIIWPDGTWTNEYPTKIRLE